MSQSSQSFLPYSEPYYAKPREEQFEPNSDAIGVVSIPRTDFDPYYSDLANYETDMDGNLLSIQDLNVPHELGPDVMATTFQPAIQTYPADLDSEPPTGPFVQEEAVDTANGNGSGSGQEAAEPRYIQNFDDIPSSPPSSPLKDATSPQRSPFHQRNRPNLDSLGILHPYGHRQQSSISRMVAAAMETPPNSGYAAGSNVMTSPFMAPPLPQQPSSPQSKVIEQQQQQSLMSNAYLPYPTLPATLGSATLGSSENDYPDLSPTLSDASSISPDLGAGSPQHEGFSWQPIVTAPRSELTESILEQQRKPKQKRKSCLPDGVVDEYVGTTDTEGVYMCLYPNCQRLFKRTYNLRSHIQTHLCDRPYVCKICNATFVRPHDLRRHERCHSTSKPYVCPCGKAFSRQDAMQRHRMRNICSGGISTGVPKSPKPRGRPKGKKNTPTQSPMLTSPSLPGSHADFKEEECTHCEFDHDHIHHHHHHHHSHDHDDHGRDHEHDHEHDHDLDLGHDHRHTHHDDDGELDSVHITAVHAGHPHAHFHSHSIPELQS